MSRTTAYELLNVHRAFGNVSAAADTLPRKVLYLLGSSSTPEVVRAEVIERAEAGEHFTHVQVKELIDKAIAEARENGVAGHAVIAAQAAKDEAAKYEKKLAAATEKYNAEVERLRTDLASALSPDELQGAIDEALTPLQDKIKRLEAERDKRKREAPTRKDEFGLRAQAITGGAARFRRQPDHHAAANDRNGEVCFRSHQPSDERRPGRRCCECPQRFGVARSISRSCKMSARNPLAIIKGTIYGALNRAYYLRELRDTGEIVEYIDKEIAEVISPSLLVEARRAWIRDLITSRFEQTECLTEQVDLFRDLDFQFAFRKKRKAYQRVLGDVNLEEGIALERRKIVNLEAAQREKARFDRHWAVIRPLLEANPDWLWRDAVAFLERSGGLPEL
jgi:hypothetical protein